MEKVNKSDDAARKAGQVCTAGRPIGPLVICDTTTFLPHPGIRISRLTRTPLVLLLRMLFFRLRPFFPACHSRSLRQHEQCIFVKTKATIASATLTALRLSLSRVRGAAKERKERRRSRPAAPPARSDESSVMKLSQAVYGARARVAGATDMDGRAL